LALALLILERPVPVTTLARVYPITLVAALGGGGGAPEAPGPPAAASPEPATEPPPAPLPKPVARPKPDKILHCRAGPESRPYRHCRRRLFSLRRDHRRSSAALIQRCDLFRPSPDHIAHVAAQWRPLFQTTALLLVVTEAAGAILGLTYRGASRRLA